MEYEYENSVNIDAVKTELSTQKDAFNSEEEVINNISAYSIT